jgi:hypothetical protein
MAAKRSERGIRIGQPRENTLKSLVSAKKKAARSGLKV